MLTLKRAMELNDSQVTEHHLIIHAKNVMYAMGAMADHFGEDRAHWMAIGYLHDYDYEKYPMSIFAIPKTSLPPRESTGRTSARYSATAGEAAPT